jgi:maleate isomerase
MAERYTPTPHRRKVGHIVPSSNTVIEPLTTLLAAELGEPVSHHFTRIPVTAISLSQASLAQFDHAPMLAAAELLSCADVDAIVWNGTAASCDAIEPDRELSRVITAATGRPASTATLAILDVLALAGLTRCALALPFTVDVSQRIVEVYAGEGITCAGLASAGICENSAMAALLPAQVAALVREADDPDAQCVLIVCTGVAGAPVVAELEQELGKPVIDSVAAAFWECHRLLGLPVRLRRWGSLLAGELAALPT